MSQTLTSILTSQGKLSAEVQNLQVYLGVAIDNLPHGMSMYDGRQRLIVANKAYREIYELPDLLMRPGTSLAHVIRHYVKIATGQEDRDAVSRQLEWVRQEVAALATGKLQVRTQRLHDGRHVRVTTQPLPNGGWVDVHEDVTDLDTHEEELRQSANHDEQTGLLNVRGLREHLAALFEQAPSNVVLHLIQLTNEQDIRMAQGFAAREALMRELGPMMAALAAPHAVARISRDLFAVVQRNSDDREVSALKAEIDSKLPQSIAVGGQSVALEFVVMQGIIQSAEVELDQLVDRIFEGHTVQ